MDQNTNTPKKRKRRFGDRRDGRRLRTLSPMSRVACYIMENRNGSSNSVRDSVDTEKIDAYVREKQRAGMKNFNFMHVMIASYLRVLSQMPALNRFIAGQEIFARNYIEVALTIKKEMSLTAPDTVVKIPLQADMTSDDVYRVLQKVVEDYRNEPGGDFDSTAKFFNRMPGLLMRFSVRFIRFLDYFGLVPMRLLHLSPFHCSMFITSMGSLGIPVIYHHLYDFGNCPVFISFGAKQHRYEMDADGNVKPKSYIDFTVVMDERITDGYYYATGLKLIKKILKNPWQLDSPPEQIIEDID